MLAILYIKMFEKYYSTTTVDNYSLQLSFTGLLQRLIFFRDLSLVSLSRHGNTTRHGDVVFLLLALAVARLASTGCTQTLVTICIL